MINEPICFYCRLLFRYIVGKNTRNGCFSTRTIAAPKNRKKQTFNFVSRFGDVFILDRRFPDDRVLHMTERPVFGYDPHDTCRTFDTIFQWSKIVLLRDFGPLSAQRRRDLLSSVTKAVCVRMRIPRCAKNARFSRNARPRPHA